VIPNRLARAWLFTAVSDGLFSSILTVAAYGSPVTRLWQGVASTLLGRSAFDGGTTTALIGVLMHFGVALTWSSVFYFIVMRWGWIRRLLATPYGVIKVAALYGPFVWLVMSLVVIPLALRRPPSIVTVRWLVQLVGHFPFVGIPIVASIASRDTVDAK